MAGVASDGNMSGAVHGRASDGTVGLLLSGLFEVKLLYAGSQSIKVEEGVLPMVYLNQAGPIVGLEALIPDGRDVIVDVGLRNIETLELNIAKVCSIGEVCLVCRLKGIVTDTSEVRLVVFKVALAHISLVLGDIKASIKLFVNSDTGVFSKRLSENVLCLDAWNEALISGNVLSL